MLKGGTVGVAVPVRAEGAEARRKEEPAPQPPVVEIPTVIYDKGTGATYTRGKLLGKGGFARCYEVTDAKSTDIFACKVVNKQLLVKQYQREKMAQEIQIHRALNHEFIVNFISYFEDDANVYITMELCSKKSLMELQKRRRLITENEARYFLRQICLAVQYLHDDRHIIHRDLKLGNIFIAENMTLKIGDFGLATTIEYDGERKKTLCGTPNYIAPEVLGKKGHSYEVDIWSIGCILYTLIIGRPPFETATLRDTYHKIKRGEYFFPSNVKVSPNAKSLLHKLLQVNPTLRPSAKKILCSEFMTQGYMPATLPSSVLTTAPRFDKRTTMGPSCGSQNMAPSSMVSKDSVGPVSSIAPTSLATNTGTNKLDDNALFKKPLTERNRPSSTARTNSNVNNNNNVLSTSQEGIPEGFGELNSTDILENMRNLRDQIKKILDIKPPRTLDDDESEDPSQCPMLWICKWVDYSDKYGFGYHLSDDSIGVSFNDQTKIILLQDGRSMHYIEKTGQEQYHRIDVYPEQLQKKVKLLKYFQQYMKDNLMKATGGRNPPAVDCIARVPNMWTWFRTSRAVVMVLSNGTMQINNFRDHSKMILCPLLGALTTMGGAAGRSMKTHRLSLMEKGLSADMNEKLKYALEKIDVLIGHPSNYSRPCYINSPGTNLLGSNAK